MTVSLKCTRYSYHKLYLINMSLIPIILNHPNVSNKSLWRSYPLCQPVGLMNNNTHISDSGEMLLYYLHSERHVLKPEVNKAQQTLTSCLFTRAPSKLKVVTAIYGLFFHFIYILKHTLSVFKCVSGFKSTLEGSTNVHSMRSLTTL